VRKSSTKEQLTILSSAHICDTGYTKTNNKDQHFLSNTCFFFFFCSKEVSPTSINMGSWQNYQNHQLLSEKKVAKRRWN